MSVVCLGCGESLAPPKSPGPSQKWCSERCRRRTLYGGRCESCGATTNGHAGPGTAAKLCRPCREKAVYGERNRRLVELWKAGVETHEIARRLDMSEANVRDWVNKARHRRGVDLPLRRRRNRELWPEIERLWHEGCTYHEIATRLGTTKTNVNAMVRTMRQVGIDLPRRQRVAV